MRIGKHVTEALAAGKPVLALESTIITHGLPRPRNLAVGLEAEEQLYAAGVTPATIGVVRGEGVVGLNRDELAELAADESVVKLSVRDLPIAKVRGLSGGTTVAATALLSHLAGVKVFSTGGLGGVHRGASTTFDESADLIALTTYPIVLVSAGVKSILDIPATLERFETLNIPIVGYRTNNYPGFYVSDSGYRVDYQVDSAAEIAALAKARDELGLTSAVVVANPVDPAYELNRELHDKTLAKALAECESRGIHGHDITPFLLDYMQRETHGESLEANLAVYRGNVALGAAIAKALSDD
ncbi:MAG: pseudouridine-5'-phosphate glycosidase [Propionibacteriaceae bacterium]|jgi:pseudouridine-5'-phosphate glycosidase|nr:pseudouridine-5'-phosphate glycosidase [Propionibacteriaceae bacterium]